MSDKQATTESTVDDAEQVTTETTATETNSTEEGTRRLSNRERRQERKQQKQQEREARLSEDGEQAPKDLFKSSTRTTTVKEDPAAAAVFIDAVDGYVATVRKGAGEGLEVQQATKAFQNAVRKLLTLEGNTLKECFKYLYIAIKENDGGSFSVPFPFRWSHKLPSEKERAGYASFMSLMLQFTKLNDPTLIHSRVDIPRVLNFIKKADQRSRIVALFPNK